MIEIRDMAFHPAEAQVNVGDTVIWINRDFVPHTATATGGVWSSPTLGQEESWYWVADGTGRGNYVCDFHPTMEGRLIINDGNLN
jgi:plastocyanin